MAWIHSPEIAYFIWYSIPQKWRWKKRNIVTIPENMIQE